MSSIELKHDWTRQQALAFYQLPLFELIDTARAIHLQSFKKQQVQLSSLYNVKTGACPEDCAYCSQSRHYHTELDKEALVSTQKTVEKAKQAKRDGATRFCMGAAWRSPKAHQLDKICDMVREVKALGLETCVTLGMLESEQADKLKAVGLDYYNHNLDTSSSFYPKVITTRTYADRLKTLDHVRTAGLKVCCGGILGLGESLDDRMDLLVTLANLQPHPESVPINQLVPIPGTPMADNAKVEELDYVRTIAVARILMPKSVIRVSAGREQLHQSTQALCYLVGANSIFLGPKLLTTKNPSVHTDKAFFEDMGVDIS